MKVYCIKDLKIEPTDKSLGFKFEKGLQYIFDNIYETKEFSAYQFTFFLFNISFYRKKKENFNHKEIIDIIKQNFKIVENFSDYFMTESEVLNKKLNKIKTA